MREATIRYTRRDVEALQAAANALDSLLRDEPGCGCASCEANARIPKRLRRLANLLTRRPPPGA